MKIIKYSAQKNNEDLNFRNSLDSDKSDKLSNPRFPRY